MELSPLRSFLAVAREGHVTRAARQLHLTQPAVSAQLARLEGELGIALFHRTPKGMVLTEAGRTLHHYVQDALVRLDDGQRALEELAGLARGELAVGGGATATTYLLPPLLREFHEGYPAIRLYVREQGSRGVVGAVLGGDLDIGFVTWPPDSPLDAVAAGRLSVTEWVTDELVLLWPPGHPCHGRGSFEWAELKGQPLVLFEAGTAVRAVIDEALGGAGVEPNIVMELRSIESIKQMVAQGIGAGFVSRFALAPELGVGAPTVGARPVEGGLHRTIAMVHRSDRTPSPAGRAFLRLARARGASIPAS
jgi:DNA-binding transcriptional LysR family regulator